MMKCKMLFIAGFIASMTLFSCKNDSSATDSETSGQDSTATKMSVVEEKTKILLGNWRSVEDPKSRISIAGSRYFEIYDGKLVTEANMEVFEKCPETCQSTGDLSSSSCFVTTDSTGAMCFVIVQLTDQDLQVSLANGTGKTLNYKRI